MPNSVRRGLVALVLLAVLSMAGFVVWAIFLNPGWDQCASEVDGQLVEHKCSEGPHR